MFKENLGIKKLIHHTPSEQCRWLPCYVHAMGWRTYGANAGNKRKAGDFYDYQLQYVLRGKGHLIWKGVEYQLGAGDLFFIDLSQAHRYFADLHDPWEAIWVHFGGPQVEHYYRLFGEAGPVSPAQEPPRIETVFHELLESYERQSALFDLVAAARLVSLLTELIARRMTGDRPGPAASPNLGQLEINKAIAYIKQQHPFAVSLENIAAHVSFSPFHFSRTFKRITGYTVQEYLLKYRISRVKSLLTHTDLPLSAIAEQTGFCDQSHMGKIFKRIERITPKQYRKNFTDTLSVT